MSKGSSNSSGNTNNQGIQKPKVEIITKIDIGSVKSGKQSAPPPPTAEKGKK